MWDANCRCSTSSVASGSQNNSVVGRDLGGAQPRAHPYPNRNNPSSPFRRPQPPRSNIWSAYSVRPPSSHPHPANLGSGSSLRCAEDTRASRVICTLRACSKALRSLSTPVAGLGRRVRGPVAEQSATGHSRRQDGVRVTSRVFWHISISSAWRGDCFHVGGREQAEGEVRGKGLEEWGGRLCGHGGYGAGLKRLLAKEN